MGASLFLLLALLFSNILLNFYINLTLVLMRYSLQPLQITSKHQNHQLTNHNIWTNDSMWIAYDCRTTPSIFDSDRIERINVITGKHQLIYQSQFDAKVGVVTVSHGNHPKYIFIHGPENPNEQWKYDFHYRRGVIAQTLSSSAEYSISNFDGFYETPPLIPGILHGGTHVHMFSPDDAMISFTYNDYLLHHHNIAAEHRNVGIGFYDSSFASDIPLKHDRQYLGKYFCVLISNTVEHAELGSDQIEKAYEECWIGENGYIKSDGSHQKYAIAFLGDTRDSKGNIITEIYKVDLPQNHLDLKHEEIGYPLSGTETNLPSQPKGLHQERLTYGEKNNQPGVAKVPRHWLRSSPDGSKIAFLMGDENGVTQLWLISTVGGLPHKITDNQHPISSAFSWHPSGKFIAFAINDAIALCDIRDGSMHYLTDSLSPPPKPEAVVCSPNGKMIAFMRDIQVHNDTNNINEIFTHIFIINVPPTCT